jgi:uncharacterized protein YifN (PemK superfamily)
MGKPAFHVAKRTILMYDFDEAGFRRPQMTKRRRVIVLRVFAPTALVVPLSATVPPRIGRHHVRIEAARYVSLGFDVWAKCDMLTHVPLDRLFRVRTYGTKQAECLTPEDFERVLRGIASAIGIDKNLLG